MNQDLTTHELHSELGDLLPAREALGLFNVAHITAANSSAALNLFTGGHEMGGHEMGGHEMGGHEMGGHEMGGHEMGGHEMGGHEMGGHEMGGSTATSIAEQRIDVQQD